MNEKGNEEKSSFKDLYESVFPILLNVSFHITGDMYIAEELCQEAFIKYLDRIYPFPSMVQAKYWLIRVIKNMSLNYKKRKSREKNAFEKVFKQQEVSERQGGSDIDFFKHEAENMVFTALEKLPEKLRTVIILKEYSDLSYREIARILNISENNVKVRVFRARSILSDLIKEEDIHVS